MSSPAPRLPDNVSAMLALLDEKTTVPEANIRVSAPTPGATASLPAIQVFQVDGESDQLDGYSVIDIHTFDRSYLDTSNLALDVDAIVMGYPHLVSSNGRSVLFDRVECLSIPSEIPWLEDNSIRRFRATYSVSFRRR